MLEKKFALRVISPPPHKCQMAPPFFLSFRFNTGAAIWYLYGGSRKKLPPIFFRKKVCFRPVIKKKSCIIWLFLRKKFASPECPNKSMLCNLLPPINIKWPLPKYSANVFWLRVSAAALVSHGKVWLCIMHRLILWKLHLIWSVDNSFIQPISNNIKDYILIVNCKYMCFWSVVHILSIYFIFCIQKILIITNHLADEPFLSIASTP